MVIMQAPADDLHCIQLAIISCDLYITPPINVDVLHGFRATVFLYICCRLFFFKKILIVIIILTIACFSGSLFFQYCVLYEFVYYIEIFWSDGMSNI